MSNDEFVYVQRMKQIDAMDRYQQHISQKNRNTVIEALLAMQNASPQELEIYIKNKSKNNEEISLSTIKRKLKGLVNEKLVTNESGTYYPSFNLQSSPHRYMPEGFGESIIKSLGYFFLDSIEQSFNELLCRFGSIILFAFIEAAHLRNEIDLSKINEDYFNSWLIKAIPLNVMWELFLGLYGYNSKRRKNPEELSKVNTSYRVNPKMLQELQRIFKKQYPQIYHKLENSLIADRTELKEIEEREKEKEKEKMKNQGKYQKGREFVKKMKTDDNGKKYIEIKSSPPNNIIYGYVSSKKWVEEIKELQDNNNNNS